MMALTKITFHIIDTYCSKNENNFLRTNELLITKINDEKSNSEFILFFLNKETFFFICKIGLCCRSMPGYWRQTMINVWFWLFTLQYYRSPVQCNSSCFSIFFLVIKFLLPKRYSFAHLPIIRQLTGDDCALLFSSATETANRS